MSEINHLRAQVAHLRKQNGEMALASVCRIPWAAVQRAYWAQVGEREMEG